MGKAQARGELTPPRRQLVTGARDVRITYCYANVKKPMELGNNNNSQVFVVYYLYYNRLNVSAQYSDKWFVEIARYCACT